MINENNHEKNELLLEGINLINLINKNYYQYSLFFLY